MRGEQDQAHIWHSGQLTIKMLYCQETGSIGAGGGRQGGRGGLSAEAGGRASAATRARAALPPAPPSPPPALSLSCSHRLVLIIFFLIYFSPSFSCSCYFFSFNFFKTHCTPNAQGRVGAGWGHLPRPGPYPQGIQSCWLWAEPHFATTSPVQSVSPQSLPLWVPISPAIHPKGLPPPMKHPPLWWAQGLGQAFLPSPLPGPLLTPRAIWLMVRTVRQGGSEPLGTQMGGGKGRGQGSGHVPSAQLFPLPLPNKGNSGPDNAGWGWPGTQGSREEKDCGDGHGQEVGVGLACPSSALPLGSRLR